ESGAGDESRINGLELLDPAEKSTLLDAWNDTRLEFPSHVLIHQLFEQEVVRNSSHIAVACKENRLSYGELNARSNQVAHYLKSIGVRPETVVGLYVEPSVEMIIGILGILKAGGAY